MTELNNNLDICPRPEIAGYIDGELSPAEELDLERHLAACRVCSEELNVQKQILLALGSALSTEPAFDLPKDFTKQIVTTAETNVTGLRRRGERMIALGISAALLIFALFALGSDLQGILALIFVIGERIAAAGGALAHLFYDIALGLSIVGKTLFSVFLFDSTISTIVLAAFTAAILFFLSRAYLRRGRARETHLT